MSGPVTPERMKLHAAINALTSPPVAFVPLRETCEAIAAHDSHLVQRITKLREALTASGDTEAAYMGEFSFNLHRIDEFGDEYPEKVYVPWETIKEIMAAVLARGEA